MLAKARAAPTVRHPEVRGVAVDAAEVDATAPTSAPREKLSATTPGTRGLAAEAAERSSDAVRDARMSAEAVTSIVSPGNAGSAFIRPSSTNKRFHPDRIGSGIHNSSIENQNPQEALRLFACARD